MIAGKARRFTFVVLGLSALVLGGCDKCGHRMHLNAPTIQHACGDEPSPR